MGALGRNTFHEVLHPGALVEDGIGGGGTSDAFAGRNNGGPGIDSEIDVDGYVAVGFVVAEEGTVGGVGS